MEAKIDDLISEYFQDNKVQDFLINFFETYDSKDFNLGQGMFIASMVMYQTYRVTYNVMQDENGNYSIDDLFSLVYQMAKQLKEHHEEKEK
jgi:hypothetical protein